MPTVPPLPDPDATRILAIDAVERASSGHPDMPTRMAGTAWR